MIAYFIEALTANKKHVTEWVNDKMREYACLPKYPERMLNEGDGAITIFEDGSIQEVEMRKMSATSEKVVKPFEVVEPQAIYQMLAGLAWELAVQHQQLFVEKIGNAAEQAGNTANYSGQLTVANIFEIYEKVAIDFYPDGTPHELEMFSNPNIVSKYKSLLEQINSDDQLRSEFTAIIQTKRKQWNDRENLRKLVG